ncbi:hypothetical protein [Pseudochrobactrum sp. HB0163]|uniref:hypothetical protein n=1 Tax=Pseudochrobactrum sp. HB0163 TaxID=3450708 RepID=UPI003F6E27D8
MIQSALVFLLGFLCAAFLILLVAPLFWKRAHYLWQKQMAAQLPVSLTSIEADRDLLRATHAVALRKAEMQAAALREKHIQALLQISADRSELEKIPQLKHELDQLQQQQKNDHSHIGALQDELSVLQSQQQSASQENARLQRQSEALSKLSDTLRQDVAAREKEADRLRREAHDLRQEKKQLISAKSELASQVIALETSLESEKRRNQALEEKLHRLITELSDTKEKLERHSKDLLRAQKQPEQIAQALSAGDQKLREQISELAAEMVARTAAKEGENSPIHALLKEAPQIPDTGNKSRKKKSKPKSLAGRIKKINV